MTQSLTIYGSPASQPSRTVFWTCLLGGVPFQLGDARDPSLDARLRNPRGQVPWLVEDGFVLAEMAAIGCYLADARKLSALYPQVLRTRARIHQYLHMHHGLVRQATYRLMAPHVVGPIMDELFGEAEPDPLSALGQEAFLAGVRAGDPLTEGGKVVRVIADFLERAYFGGDTPFVCGTPSVSLADLACYGELGQLGMANLFDFSAYPRIRRWIGAMAEVPFHDPVHAYNSALGDIADQPNTMTRFLSAIAAGEQALRDTGLVSW